MIIYLQINMEALNIFLKALESRLHSKRGFFVPVINTINCKFPAYKKESVEVWCIDGEYKTLISKVEVTERMVTEEEKQYVKEKLLKKTFKNILKYYGI